LRYISLSEETRQVRDITGYVGFVVETDPQMQVWRATEKEPVIETLIRKLTRGNIDSK